MATIRLRRAGGVYGHLEPQADDWAADVDIDDLGSLEGVLSNLEPVHQAKGS
jgi:hypothetical protein